MPAAFAMLIGAQLLGEIARRLFHLPLPGPVIGMFLLAVALVTFANHWIVSSDGAPAPLTQVAQSLIGNMGLLFVPAGVGIVAELGVLERDWIPIAVGLLVSTLLGLVVTGLVMHHLTRLAERRQASASEEDRA